VAEHAAATTLVTTEGRALTEVALTVRNHAQPFLKVKLPEGATLLTAEVAGEAVKPVKGDDGTRVPLLRAGFRPSGPYAVSYVYLLPGAPFAKKGETSLSLPQMDVPVSLVDWELFLPERYRVKDFGGNALVAEAVAPPQKEEAAQGMAAEMVIVAAAGNIRRDEPQQQAPSSNVVNLQRRVAGVLPVRMDVPRAGASYRFVRPLVLDEETTVRFRYKAR
jgi:hypothetical protein